MAYKRYRSLFSEKRLNNSSKFKIQEKIRRILREKSLTSKDIDSIVGKIEGVITDVISNYGVDNTLVDELSNTVKNINSYGSSIAAQNAAMNQASTMEENFRRKQKRLKENMFGDVYSMDASADMYNDDEMYASDIDYADEFTPVENLDPMAVDEFGHDIMDEPSFYENRKGKINRLSRKLKEGELSEGDDEDFITDSVDITTEEDEEEAPTSEEYGMDEEDEAEYSEEDEEVVAEEDEMEYGEDEEMNPADEDEDEINEDDEEMNADKQEEAFYFEDDDAEAEESEADEEGEKKEHFRRNRLRRESRSFRKPIRRNAYREESESEEGEDMIPMDNGSDYEFLDGIDEYGNAPSQRSMIAKDDPRKGM